MDVRKKLVELKKVLRECLHFNYDEISCEMSLDVDLTAENLLAHGVAVQEWISVEERLPAPGERVLALAKGTREMIVATTGENGIWWNGHRDARGWEVIRFPTHWMPLPAPPKEGE